MLILHSLLPAPSLAICAVKHMNRDGSPQSLWISSPTQLNSLATRIVVPSIPLLPCKKHKYRISSLEITEKNELEILRRTLQRIYLTLAKECTEIVLYNNISQI